MRKAILSGLRQAVGIRFLLAVIGVVVMLFVANIDNMLRIYQGTIQIFSGYHTDFILFGLRSDTIAPFVPIFAALPFAAGYVDDVKSKFVRYYIVRSGRKTYLFSRVAVCFLSGGLVLAVGTLLGWGVSALVFLPMEQPRSVQPYAAQQVLQITGHLFLSGGLWAMVGMALSTVMESKYISYAIPFVLYYLLVILYERYFPEAYMICPREWYDPSAIWKTGPVDPAALVIGLTAVFAALYIFQAGRRLKQL